MTLTTLITLNAALAALAAGGMVWLLAAVIRADRAARSTLRAARVPAHREQAGRLAA